MLKTAIHSGYFNTHLANTRSKFQKSKSYRRWKDKQTHIKNRQLGIPLSHLEKSRGQNDSKDIESLNNHKQDLIGT